MKLQNAVYGLWYVSKVRGEPVCSKKKIKITSDAQEIKDSAVHYMAFLCWRCRARRNKK